MAVANLSAVVAAVWEEVHESSPDVLNDSWLFDRLTGGVPRSYRARLDERLRNYRGAIIPRIAIVKRNLRLLGPTRLDPARLR